MNAKVLVLNQNYEAISICTARKAIVLSILNKAEIVETKNGFKINSQKFCYSFPSIIRLQYYLPYKFRTTVLSRKNILRRDGHKCQYCGRSDLPLTIDHVIPRAKGGKDSWENLTTACTKCNNIKGDKTPEETGIKCINKPIKPSHIMFLKHFVGQIDEKWKPYLYSN